MGNQVESLKKYLRRLGAGEDLEKVRKDFAVEFQDVDATVIMKAEQEMLAEGTPLSEVQKLCDVHAALFHGATREEKIANAEREVNAAMIREERTTKTQKLIEQKGHPLYTFTKENEALAGLLDQIKTAACAGDVTQDLLGSLRDISIHYAKKGDLLYPHLNVQYGISGPSNVMWTVDDEIRDEISALLKDKQYDKKWYERLLAVVQRAEEMIYKEANILFPNCAANFTEEEWIGIYHDQKDYADCLGVKAEIWEGAESNKKISEASFSDSEIIMPGGHLTVEQLTALLNTIPLEITFVDVHNINRFFNEGPRILSDLQWQSTEKYFRAIHQKWKPKYAGSLRNFVQEHWTRYRFGWKRTVNVCWYDTSQLETPKIIIWELWNLYRIWILQKNISHLKSRNKLAWMKKQTLLRLN